MRLVLVILNALKNQDSSDSEQSTRDDIRALSRRKNVTDRSAFVTDKLLLRQVIEVGRSGSATMTLVVVVTEGSPSRSGSSR